MTAEYVEYDYEALPENSTTVDHLIAGALAGIAEHTIMYPFDSIKTRMQIIQPTPQTISSGVIRAMTKISTTEGMLTLWRGVNSVIIGAGPSHALYFATYEKCKEIFGANDLGHQPISVAAAGACATIAADALMTPFDTIKQRMQISGNRYFSSFQCAHSVLRHEGISAFYISYPTTLLMSIPFQSIQFASYESLRKFLNPNNRYDPKVHIVSGGLSGALAAAITTPFDVMKTLLQTKGVTQLKVNGMVEAAKIIHQKYGMFGFFHGLKPRMISHMPSTAIAWTVYEYFKWRLKKRSH